MIEKNPEKRILLFAGLTMAASELIKQLLLTASSGGVYQWWYLPWQLCSIPMYVCITAGLCSSVRIYEACLSFLSCFGMLAGAGAFLDTTGFRYELDILTVHSYVWHIVLIITGIYAWHIRSRRREFRYSFRGGLSIYLLGCIAAEIINLTAYKAGFRPINMFYISPKYQMDQVCIRDLVPFIGNIPAIILYVFVTGLGAFIIDRIGRKISRVTGRVTGDGSA